MMGATSGPVDTERSRTLWFALLLTLANGFLDAHTYLARGGVFANVQTANVIFSAIDLSERKLAAALAHVWPLLAFIAGMLLASHIKSGRMERIVPHSLRWTMGVQAVVLAIIGLCPPLWTTPMSLCRFRFSLRSRSACSATSATWPTCPWPRPAT